MPSSSPALRSLLVLCLAVPVRGARAQFLPGETRNEKSGDYAARVRLGIDSTLRRWEQAAASRDADGVARLYEPTAIMTPRVGTPIHGRPALNAAFANVLPRMSAVHFVAERVTVSGDLAAVAGELTYQVPFPSGGSYERRERVQLAMRVHLNDGWRIELQSGGDLPPAVAWVRPPKATLRPGEIDTLTVRVTDALGGGIPDVLVAFGGEDAGLFTPAGVSTDARGEATAYRTAGATESVGALRVTPSVEPHEALLAMVRTVVPAVPADGAAAGPGTTGGIPRP